jgi:hypothetical protein
MPRCRRFAYATAACRSCAAYRPRRAYIAGSINARGNAGSTPDVDTLRLPDSRKSASPPPISVNNALLPELPLVNWLRDVLQSIWKSVDLVRSRIAWIVKSDEQNQRVRVSIAVLPLNYPPPNSQPSASQSTFSSRKPYLGEGFDDAFLLRCRSPGAERWRSMSDTSAVATTPSARSSSTTPSSPVPAAAPDNAL